MNKIEDYIKLSLEIINKNNNNFCDNNIIKNYNKKNIIFYYYETITKDMDINKIEYDICVLVKKDKFFEYQEWYCKNIKSKIFIKNNIIIENLKIASDIIQTFVKDSYYDSPIKFLNMKKIDESYEEFLENYKKYDDYFYMGIFNSKSTKSRIYVKYIDNYNNYIEI